MRTNLDTIAQRFFLGEKLTSEERKALAESKKYREMFTVLGGSRTANFDALAEQVAPLPTTVSNHWKAPKRATGRNPWSINRSEVKELTDEIEDRFKVHPLDFSDMQRYDKIDPQEFESFIKTYVENNVFDDSTINFILRVLKERATPKAILAALYSAAPGY